MPFEILNVFANIILSPGRSTEKFLLQVDTDIDID